MADAVRRRVVVHGRVQGVFFRDSCRSEAERAGVTGWVCNRDDGAVEAVLEGSPDAVKGLVDWMGSGPDHARVESVEVRDEEPVGERAFEVR